MFCELHSVVQDAKKKLVSGPAHDFWWLLLGKPKVCLVILYQIDIHVYYMLGHAFTCAGILPRQYIKFSSSAGIGTVEKWYNHKGNIAVIFYGGKYFIFSFLLHDSVGHTLVFYF